MAASVRLEDIIEVLELQLDEASSYLDTETGTLHTVSKDLLQAAEEREEPYLPKWQEQEWKIAQQIFETERFLKLPSNWDVHEWDIMRQFSDQVESANIRADLLRAIHGRGAFRIFKDTVQRYGMESSWRQFRTSALREIATDWCEEHRLQWR